MKNLILILAACTLIGLAKSEPVYNVSSEKDVYICNSSGASKYHYDKNCRGIKRCKHEVKKVTEYQAKKKYERTLCGYED